MSDDDDAPAPGIAISKDESDLLDEKQVVGRKIWRIVPSVSYTHLTLPTILRV